MKTIKDWFKLRMLKDVDSGNSNNKDFCDLREQLFILGEANMVLQGDNSRLQ